MARHDKSKPEAHPAPTAPPGYATPPPGYATTPPGYATTPPGYGQQPAPGQYPPPGYPAAPGYLPAGYQVPPPGYELKKKKRFYKRVWFWLFVIFVAIIAIIIAVIASVAHDATSKPHTVVYTVDGSIGRADISYFTVDGSSHSESISADKQQLPWTKSVTVKGDLSGFVLSATTSDLTGAGGTLTCSLSVDGKVVSTDKASGTADTVSCDGSGYDGN